jgi:hypothetical protein
MVMKRRSSTLLMSVSPKSNPDVSKRVISPYVGFEVITAVGMKNTNFWDITLCSLSKVKKRFGETSPPSSGSKNKLSKKPA